MKKLWFSFVVALVFLFSASVASLAYDVDTTYVPEVPPFLDASGASVKFRVPIPKNTSDEISAFFDDFEESPHLILIEQWSKSGSYMGKTLSEGDRYWWVDFIKYQKSKGSESIGGFEYNGGTFGSGYWISPMRYNGSSALGLQRVSMKYDFETGQFLNATTVSSGTSPIAFSYAFSGCSLSGSCAQYPYYNTLNGPVSGGFGGAFTFYSFSDVAGIDRHYNWWLGVSAGIPNIDIGVDTDGDGKPDINIDTDGDREPDLNVDTNGDKKPDVNIDTDGDGKPDINIDTDGNKKPDLNVDTDGDKKPDINIDSNGDGKPDINVDTDGDGKADVNIDKDGDGKPDINIDSNGDKKPDINIDSNGDGKPDINVDTDGDGKPDINVDTNGDGKPDINIDTDGDGNSDVNIDTDNDGKPDKNVRPDGGSGGGSSGGGGGSGGTVVPPKDDSGLGWNGWNLFDPFKYDNYSSPSYSGNDPYSDYDPLEGYEYNGGYMPAPDKPDLSKYNFHNPFLKPDWLK